MNNLEIHKYLDDINLALIVRTILEKDSMDLTQSTLSLLSSGSVLLVRISLIKSRVNFSKLLNYNQKHT
jgi:hypothetical protein